MICLLPCFTPLAGVFHDFTQRETRDKKMDYQIIVASAYTPKDKVFLVGGYVEESGFPGLPRGTKYKTLFNYAIDEDKESAKAEMLARIYADNTRHPADMTVNDKGRVSIERLVGITF